MRFGVIRFPGTWSDRDCGWALEQVLGVPVRYLWHAEPDLHGCDCVVLPGGFSYGDHLRPGAVARFSPVMAAVTDFAQRGGLVLGICNGFQILCEAGLLPGALVRNACCEFRCQWTHVRCERTDTPFTRAVSRPLLRIPISHGDGAYWADPELVARLEERRQVVFRYCDEAGRVTAEANPNGSVGGIAGIVNEAGNVLGMMPHPERCCEAELGGTDGLELFRSLLGEPVA